MNALLIAVYAAGEWLHSLAWSSCNGLAAVTITQRCDAKGRAIWPIHCAVHVLLPGQQLASMTLSCERASVTWSPAGDRLLVDKAEYDFELVTSACASVQHFAACRASFSPCGRYLVVNGGESDKVVLSICRTLDGSQVFSFAGCHPERRAASFNLYGDVLILAGSQDMHVIYLKWGANSSSAYSRQLCKSAAAACRSANELAHSCCNDW